MTPRVSVLVNTYNHEKFIAQSLQSVLDQDFPASEMEIIVVDDGSTDRTSEIVQSFLPRIRYIRKPNGGQVSAFHAGVAETRGEIIAFLDGDDWWATEKLTKVIGAFDAHPNVACVGHAYYEVDETGSIFATMVPTITRLSFESPSSARLAVPFRVFLGTSRFAIRRNVLERTLPVPPDVPFFDTFIFTQAIAISGAALLPEPLCYYRLHAGNLFASRSPENGRLRTRYALICSHLEHLPSRLVKLGVPEETVNALLECDRVDTERLRLVFEGGKPWETFRVERAAYRIACRDASIGYRMFTYFVLMLTLLMPTRIFYRLRAWYASGNLRRFRERIARVPVANPGAVRHIGDYTNASPSDRA